MTVTKGRAVFNQINLVVRDMAAMVEFYQRLGIEVADTVAPWDRHHRTFADSAVVEGFDVDLDSQPFASQWDQGWPQGKAGTVLGFRLPSSDDVDKTYRELIDAGYLGQQPPWDAFFGARYAVVADPDGNSVGLMGPVDPSRGWMPSPPDE
jgi:catechol 2,3-dioxygenase-like lactoylglutathione lyase family enzyme